MICSPSQQAPIINKLVDEANVKERNEKTRFFYDSPHFINLPLVLVCKLSVPFLPPIFTMYRRQEEACFRKIFSTKRWLCNYFVSATS